ncbi:hypothetical protein ERJ75_001000400 [Trypanosoma vivax]|nr:hypothetical protein TRVL_00973 [Trypanosoma vivax]KAH8611114.1 hypothetical protein ERJ75_001000400 [Trypanosoma vivax]
MSRSLSLVVKGQSTRVRAERHEQSRPWSVLGATGTTSQSVPRPSSHPQATLSATSHSCASTPVSCSLESKCPVLEGPLPAEVREMIYAACAGEDAEVAERHARRLISTNRRVRVYRAELQSAVEETGDVTRLIQQGRAVESALRAELCELDKRMEELMRERQVCDFQLKQQQADQERKEAKLREANERVKVLRETIENITNETLSAHMLLKKLIPNLHVDNYVS